MTHGLSFPEHLQTVLSTMLHTQQNSNQVPPKNNNRTQNSLPNPIDVHANSSNSAAAATSFTATKLPKTQSANNQDTVQIHPISLQLGDDNPSIFLSVETLEKFKKHCSSEGFKKLFTGELQLDSYPRCLWFLKILSMADCTEDFKEILNDCYHLEMFKFDETTFNGLRDLALALGAEKIAKMLLDNKYAYIDNYFSIIQDDNKEIIFNRRPSPNVITRLGQLSEKFKAELSKSEIKVGPLLSEILYDLRFLGLEDFNKKLNEAFDKLNVKKRGPFKLIALIREAQRWDLKDLEKKYLKDLYSQTLSVLSVTSNKFDLRRTHNSQYRSFILQSIYSIVRVIYFLSAYPDKELSTVIPTAINNFFQVHLRDFVILPNMFDEIVKMIKTYQIKELDFSESDLSDQNLATLAQIQSLQKLNIQGCPSITREGIEDFKAQSLAEVLGQISDNVLQQSQNRREKESSTGKSLPNPTAIQGNSAAAGASASSTATHLSEALSTNNQDTVQIDPIFLRMGSLNPPILISEETLKKLKKHCSPEGFKKLFTEEFQAQLQSNPLCFLKILSMVPCDCTEDFKEILIDCYHLERRIIDERAFQGIRDLALTLGVEIVTKRLDEDKEKMIGKRFSIISDKTIETIFETRPSKEAYKKLGEYSKKAKEELSKRTPNLSCLLEELMSDLGCLNPNKPNNVNNVNKSNDQKLQETFDQLKRIRGPFKFMALMNDAHHWGLTKLEKKYQYELRSRILSVLKDVSHKFNMKQDTESSILYSLSSINKVASLLFDIFPNDTELSTAYNNFFQVHLRDLISFPLTFNNIVLLIRNSPIKKLDFSGLNLNAQNLNLLSQIESLKTVKIQECSVRP